MTLKIRVFDKPWKVTLLTGDEFNKRFPGCDGITIGQTYSIYLSTEALRMDVVAHEVFHCYRSMLCSSSASITKDQEEEICCELFGTYHQDMVKLAKYILKQFEDEKDA